MKAELDTYRTLSDGNEQIGDMIKKELLGFSMWIVNEDIKQKGRTDKDLGSSSLMQCFGQVKEVVRDADVTLAPSPLMLVYRSNDDDKQWRADALAFVAGERARLSSLCCFARAPALITQE